MTDPTSDLVAFAHGELDADAARAVRGRLAADPELRAELAALRAADAALRDALEAPRRPRLAWWRPALAAAALLVVALLFALPRGTDAAAQNDVVALRVQPAGGARQPVFTDVALELTWQNRLPRAGGQRLRVLPFHLADDPATLAAAEAAAIETRGKFVPLVVSATIHAPDGQHLPARLTAETLAIADGEVQRVPLHRFELDTDAPPPYLGGAPGDRAWVEDFDWAFRHLPADGPRRLLLDQVGEWTIELRVESIPPPEPGLWPTFAEPLVVATKVFATGLVGDWGPTVDGLQARIVLATGCDDLERAPLALQLRNVSFETRRYNVVGTTLAAIPQPFHFRLLLGEQKLDPLVAQEPRDDLAVQIGESVLMVPHPGGTVRSLVVCADYWRKGRAHLRDLPDIRTIQMQFEFRPTLSSDPSVWQGQLSTCRMQLPPPAER